MFCTLITTTIIIIYCHNYLPMHRYSEDGLDVGQHGLKVLWVLLEAHLSQDHRLVDILERKHKCRKYLNISGEIICYSSNCFGGFAQGSCLVFVCFQHTWAADAIAVLLPPPSGLS